MKIKSDISVEMGEIDFFLLKEQLGIILNNIKSFEFYEHKCILLRINISKCIFEYIKLFMIWRNSETSFSLPKLPIPDIKLSFLDIKENVKFITCHIVDMTELSYHTCYDDVDADGIESIDSIISNDTIGILKISSSYCLFPNS